ncbi:MAG TPA: RNA polymerase sigma factor [Planctomycetota bacterium]|nr:RNA polymerase sigma factor [Planctomycetota bacterium]
MADPTEDLLIRRAVAGDRDAQAALWAWARRFVAAVLVGAGAHESEVQDLVQETAIAFTRGIPALREPAAFRGWLRTLAQNSLRAARRRAPAVPLASEPPAPDHDAFADADEVQAVRRALAELPDPLREALVLKAVEGLSQRAIAAVLGVPETTVESRLARARRALRAALARGRALCGTECPNGRNHEELR